MKLLAIDTATEACSVALEINGKVFSCFEVCPQQHSQRILPMIDKVLNDAQITLSELDYLVVGRGPGSFTGVRIATGILQGLALGTGLKVVPVSTMAAMAKQAFTLFPHAQVFTAIDARMSEVYFAQYQLKGEQVSLVAEEQVLPPEQAQTLIDKANADKQFVGVGTGWQAYSTLNADDKVTVIEDILYPNAEHMLPLAEQGIEQGIAVDIEDMQPVYLRDKVTWKKLPGRE